MAYLIKNKLKEYRKFKGYESMRHFANDMQIRRATLMDLEKNTENVILINIMRICKNLDCKFEDLFELIELEESTEFKKTVRMETRGRKPLPIEQLSPKYLKRKLRKEAKRKELEELEKNDVINR